MSKFPLLCILSILPIASCADKLPAHSEAAISMILTSIEVGNVLDDPKAVGALLGVGWRGHAVYKGTTPPNAISGECGKPTDFEIYDVNTSSHSVNNEGGKTLGTYLPTLTYQTRRFERCNGEPSIREWTIDVSGIESACVRESDLTPRGFTYSFYGGNTDGPSLSSYTRKDAQTGASVTFRSLGFFRKYDPCMLAVHIEKTNHH